MQFNEIPKEKILRRRIAEVRPILEEHYKAFNIDREISDTNLSEAHYCYNLRIDDLNSEITLPKERGSLRVRESDAKGHIAFYEFGLGEKKSKYFQVYLDEKSYTYFTTALEDLKKTEKENANGEIRHLRVAALNLEIVWLHYKGNDEEDKFKLNQYFGEPQPLYDKKQLLNLINELKKKLHKMNSLMGG